MKPLINVLEEMSRTQWAILPPSLRAMLAVLDGEELTADDYRFFHAVGEQEKEQIQSAEYFGTPIPKTSYSYRNQNAGYLLIDGPIIPRATWFSNVSGLVSIDVLTKEFKAFEEDPRIDTIVMLFDSPGGAIPGISDFSKTVRGSDKNTVAFAWMAASAAYWIASAADILVAPDTGIVGSIGTVLTMTDTSERDAKRGVKTIEIVSSQSPDKRPDARTPEGRKVYQKLVNDLATVFVNNVAENRGVSSEDVLSKFGAGAMVVAARALSVGMIDKIESLEGLSRGLTGKNNTVGFLASEAEAPTEESMKPNEKKELTAEELKENSAVAALLEEAKAAAKEEGITIGVEAERARIQAIEGLGAKFDASLPTVKAAALGVINSEKFKAEATVETVTAAVLEVVATAQVDAVEDFGKTRREAAKAAGHASKATPSSSEDEASEEASEKRSQGLIAARDKREGKAK